MSDVLAVLAYIALPLIGIGIWRVEAVRRLDLDGRIAVAGAAGGMIVGAVLATLSILSIGWSRAVVIPILSAIVVVGFFLKSSKIDRKPKRQTGRLAITSLSLLALLVFYGLLTARVTSRDLFVFWGTSAVQFYRDGGVTLGHAGLEIIARMRPGYPLLVPLTYSWAEIAAGQFSWWAAVLTSGLLLFGSVALVRASSRDDRGAVLMAATLAYAFAIAYVAGGAEPALIFFETMAIIGVTFIRDPRGQMLIAGLGLAGTVMTKLEGATFALAFVLAMLAARRSFKRTLAIAAPTGVLLIVWLGIVKAHHLGEYYRTAIQPMYFGTTFKSLAALGKAATYDLYGLPWLVPIILILIAPNRRNAAIPLIVSILTFGATIFFYVHIPDPAWWILDSARRVLLTPLTALLI
ncbi:MAG: hypothetical protein ACRD3J_04695, partial [Thermoanaerobaculia bacterium]